MNDITTEASAALRACIRRRKLRAELDERDENLRYEVTNYRSDFEKHNRSWLNCGCNYTRSTRKLQECEFHKIITEELESE